MNERKGGVLGVDGELAAMQSIRRTLNKLDQKARYRVINYFAAAVCDDAVNGAECAGKQEPALGPQADADDPGPDDPGPELLTANGEVPGTVS